MILDLERLQTMVAAGAIDTIIMAAPDMQGRLQGKRVMPKFFFEHVLNGAAEGCGYLLATDIECQPVPGYQLMSLDQGFGDFGFAPDLASLRLASWQEGAAIILCDFLGANHTPVAVAPRQLLKTQLERLAALGLHAFAATELEFLVFRNTYEEAWERAYRGLTPANQYNNDYSILGTARVEPLIRKIRNAMQAAGIEVENSKGECNFGQHEINFCYGPALTTADNHVIYKEAAKELAAASEMALSFMAKFNEREGNSCHVHLSLQDESDRPAERAVFDAFLAGILANAADLSVFYAPNINSYKRYATGSFAPTALAWGLDNRTCALRVLGHGASLRVENRLPGGDVNPYLALAGMIASGLDGIERSLALPPAFTGNAYEAALPRVPKNLAAALRLWRESPFLDRVFGPEVVAHYANMAQVELDAFDSAVTDWERFRGFERI